MGADQAEKERIKAEEEEKKRAKEEADRAEKKERIQAEKAAKRKAEEEKQERAEKWRVKSQMRQDGKLFDVDETKTSFAFMVDRSGSMWDQKLSKNRGHRLD